MDNIAYHHASADLLHPPLARQTGLPIFHSLTLPLYMNLSQFRQNLTRYSRHYSPQALFDKIGKVARKAGVKTVHGVLILYYATFDKNLPVKDRLLVLAALGYFILPVDMLPDALPGGFADDAAALGFVIRHIWNNLSDETFSKARRKLADWFGPDDSTSPSEPMASDSQKEVTSGED